MPRGTECPAIAELKKVLNSVFPSVETGTIRFPDPADRHTSGLAMDVMLDIREPEEERIADGIIDVLIANHASMEWSDIIYSDRKPDGSISYYHIPGGGHGYGYGGEPLKRNNYTGDTEHTNHFHIDWVDFSLKNPPPLYSSDPYQQASAAKKTGFCQRDSARSRGNQARRFLARRSGEGDAALAVGMVEGHGRRRRIPLLLWTSRIRRLDLLQTAQVERTARESAEQRHLPPVEKLRARDHLELHCRRADQGTLQDHGRCREHRTASVL
ncbi:MAG: hypothetical protein U0Q16_25115 [Bryobacteraceae bacterium]